MKEQKEKVGELLACGDQYCDASLGSYALLTHARLQRLLRRSLTRMLYNVLRTWLVHDICNFCTAQLLYRVFLYVHSNTIQYKYTPVHTE